jgi:cytochrome d ubiquinol oxidase subunit II
MLIALVFRGVAFEFRFEDRVRRAFWDRAFQVGSFVAVFAQGVVLGAFIQGFRVEGRVFSGTSVDFLTPFSILTGLALLFGYGLLGAGWLIIKTEGALQDWARRQGRLRLIGVVIGIVIVSLWTPLMEQQIAERWSPCPISSFFGRCPSPLWRLSSGNGERSPARPTPRLLSPRSCFSFCLMSASRSACGR